MWVQFKPNASTLIGALESKIASTGDSVIDCWFRLSFAAKIALRNSSVTIFDDAGYFFQKWVLALTVDAQAKPVFFVRGWLDYDGISVTLKSPDDKVVLQGNAVKECVSLLVEELQEQLRVMEEAYPGDAVEIAFTSDTYLVPLQKFLKQRQGD